MKALVFLFLIFCCSCSLLTKSKLENWSTLPLLTEQEQRCLIDTISMQQQNINTYRALIDTIIAAGHTKYNLRQITIFERPDNSRIEILQPGLNQTASIIVTRDGELVAYSALKKIGYRGQANIDNYYRLLGLPMATDELMMWLAGIVITNGELRFYRDLKDTKYFIITDDGKRVIRTELDILKGSICSNPELRVRAIEIVHGDDLLFSSQYEYLESNEVSVNMIKFHLEEVDLSGEMRLEHVEKNFNIKDKREKLFYFEFPASATIKQIEDLNQDNILLPAN